MNNAVISGLCAGVARQANVDTLWVRTAAVLGLVFAPPLFLASYFIGAILVPKS
ncbi:PspC domain-containing protein [Alteromonas sp. 5E99-2]|nr:PspC domain-containing protein [Alteromonas sp. 5E99-2]